MSKIKKHTNKNNGEIYNFEDINVLEYSEFRRLEKTFNKTRISGGFGTKLGSLIFMIVLLPLLLVSLLFLTLSVKTTIDAFTGKTSMLMNDWVINSFNDIMLVLDNQWKIGSLVISTTFNAKAISMIVLVTTLFIFLLFLYLFSKNFSLFIGKLNKRTKLEILNIIVIFPAIILFVALLISVSSGIGSDTNEIFKKTIKEDNLMYSYLVILLVFMFGTLPSIFSKYDLKIAVKIQTN